MNVLHLTHTFLPVTENWIYNQLVFNTRCTSSVLCQYRENDPQFPFDAVFPRFARKTVLNEFRLKLALKQGRYSVRHTRRVIDRVKPDVVHGHFAFVSCCHREALSRYSLPLVTTCYGLDISKLPRRAIWQKRYADLFTYGAAFIVEGPHMADCLAELGCPVGKIHCIPIGIDLKSVRDQESPKTVTSDTTILFTGLAREKKGGMFAASAFINAAIKHPDLHFDLIGKGRYLEPVRFLLDRAGLSTKCTFHGSVSVKRYLELLHGSDIVLAPSLTAADGDTEGGAPVTVIEAQAAGIPVVGTRHCDMPLVVKHGETGLLCEEKNVMGLSSNLVKLIADVDLRNSMGKAAAVHAASQHDIKKQVEKINEVYLKCSTMRSVAVKPGR